MFTQLALLVLGIALAGCNADLYFCQVSGIPSGRGTYFRSSTCAIASTPQEVCQRLEIPTPAPAMLTYLTAGPYSQRERCEQRGLLDSLFPPADAGRP